MLRYSPTHYNYVVQHCRCVQKFHRAEQELLKRENYGSSVRVYAMVDLELGVPYSLKVSMCVCVCVV